MRLPLELGKGFSYRKHQKTKLGKSYFGKISTEEFFKKSPSAGRLTYADLSGLPPTYADIIEFFKISASGTNTFDLKVMR